MCGIVGAVAQRNIVPVLLEGLKRLEYRGYDSCGVAVNNGGLKRARSVARVAELQQQVADSGFGGNTGIAHTRWATHGAPATNNAHPHFSSRADGQFVALVHNGIIENYEEIRTELRALGYVFESQTDTEAIAHLVNHLYDGDLLRTVQKAVKRLTGAFAIGVFCRDEPNRVVGARLGCPLIVGLGQGENFLASDAMALAGSTDQIVYLEEGDVVDIGLDGVQIYDRNDAAVERVVQTVNAYSGAIDLGPYRHYMQKEIFEQPRAITDTLEGVLAFTPELFGPKAEAVFKDIDSVLILACGTSYYSGMTARYWLESLAGLPTTVEVASEFRYRKPAVNPRALVVVISQSGETADTLAALKYAKELGIKHSLAICNVGTSAMVRETELSYLTRAGVEIGVASTKAFTTQLAALFLLTLTLAKLKGQLTAEQEAGHLKNLRHLPAALTSVLALEPHII
ncbi:MAG: glutamine--fructose-6-phosphate transaminase (isomerizing), partial [Janthinobacterium lividum]